MDLFFKIQEKYNEIMAEESEGTMGIGALN